jgi:hypothetical protein
MSKALTGSGVNTSPLQRVGGQSTVKFFQEGRTFPQCPNCGAATGWTLVEDLQPRTGPAAARHDDSVSESSICDVCSQPVFRPAGYLLTTTQVVSTPAYWRHYYQCHRVEFVAAGVASFDAFCRNTPVRNGCAEALAGQSTPWLLCPQCIGMFTVDQERSHADAMRWWDSGRDYAPFGSGAAPLSSVDMGDRPQRSIGTAPGAQAAPQRRWWEVWK